MTPIKNLLFEPVEYKVEETRLGVWRRFRSEKFGYFEEFVSHRRCLGLPWVHYTRGLSPESGQKHCALGIVAVGRKAVGFIAVGQFAAGVIAVGQIGVGIFLGLGQLAAGVAALGQCAVGSLFGLGQLSTGYVAIGQLGIGVYVIAQKGMGRHVCDAEGISPIALQFLQSLIP